MSDVHALPEHAAHDAAHGEHLEVWPDAGITETAKKVPLWLVILYFGFAGGLVVAYFNQFIWCNEGYPKYGPNYANLDENTQYPDKINPKIELNSQVNWTVGEDAELLLMATGGRVGRVWDIEPSDALENQLPPGIEKKQTPHGYALTGAPQTPGIYTVKVICTSGSGKAEKTIEINVAEAGAASN